MKKTTVISQKRRGPPATGKGQPIVVRVQPPLIEALDGWISKQAPPFPSRPEAIRRLVELGLIVRTERTSKSEGTKRHQGTKQRACELAGDAVDEMTDTTATAQDQASRKRRLIKGPEEFRKARVDLQKAKEK